METRSEEQEFARLVQAGDFRRAATAVLSRYGPEVYGFLIHLMASESDAAEVFSQTAEDLWRGLPTFASGCTLRSWLYLLARHAASRFRRSPWNRGGRTGDEALDEAVAVARSSTAPWLRTDVKDRWRQLRDALDDADRALLVLRVDRNMPWNEVARVMLGDEVPSPGDLARESARLRKRLQHLKGELRRRAVVVGLIIEDT